jgi:hypothetical protein
MAHGDYAAALQLASSAWETHDALGGNTEPMKEAFAIAVRAALLNGDGARADELLGVVESAGRGAISPLTRARAMGFRARLAADAGDVERGDRLFRGAAALLRELATPFPMAVTLLEHAEMAVAAGDPAAAEPLVAEARAVFEELRAVPWMARADRVAGRVGDRVAS